MVAGNCILMMTIPAGKLFGFNSVFWSILLCSKTTPCKDAEEFPGKITGRREKVCLPQTRISPEMLPLPVQAPPKEDEGV